MGRHPTGNRHIYGFPDVNQSLIEERGWRHYRCGEETRNEIMMHDRSAHDELIARIAKLNTAERDCLVRVNEGKVSKDIARELGLSPNYVDTCLKQAAVKLNVKGRYLAAKMLADTENYALEDTVTSAPSNLVLQSPGLSSSPGTGDKKASAGEGNGSDDLGHREHHGAGSIDPGRGEALPKLSVPFAKFFTGENRLSKRQRLLLIFAGTIAFIFAFGGLVNIVLGISRFISNP
ncbi:helix-turn-helix transcriptional regulator [Sphingopyxis panaciterrae]